MILTHICRTIAIAGHTGDLPTVLDGLTHEAAEVRVVDLGAADRLDALDLERLRAALADPAIEVRYRAVELAAKRQVGAQLASEVIAALDDADLSEVAAFALGELPLAGADKQAAVMALGRQATGHDDALCRESAVAALGALEDGLVHILTATTDVATVRRRAVLALAPFEGPEVDEALAAAIEDRDWQVRQAAEDLLA